MQLPRALPDELLFGRIIRYLILSGEEPDSFVEKVLLSRRHTFHPTLTAGLFNLAKFTDETPGNLLYNQTIAPIFMFYVPRHSQKLRELLLGTNGNKVLWESQLASFGQGHSCCLKWCSQCAAEDIFNHGISYWHRSHQIPGISACYRHQQQLQIVDLRSRQKLARCLLPTSDDLSFRAVNIESKVSQFSSDLLSSISERRALFDWASSYRNKLEEKQYITKGKRIRRIRLFEDFYREVSPYPYSKYCSLPKSSKDYRYISELLHSNSSHHPFRHLLFSSWLFDNAAQLLSQKKLEKRPVVINVELESSSVEKRCLGLLQQGESMAYVSRLTGKSRCYLKRIALLHGIHLNLKPRQLTNRVKAKILYLARLSMHRDRISTICNIGVGSVEQVISSQKGLVEWRKKCHLESKRRRYRLMLRRYIVKEPNALRRDIKASCSAAFFWLYGNDKEWLDSALPLATKPFGFGRFY